MPIGGWEILILAVIALIFFGYKRLPEIGRAAGQGARQLKEGLQRKGADVSERAPDAEQVGRTAGKHVREYRELKEEIMSSPAKPEPKKEEEN